MDSGCAVVPEQGPVRRQQVTREIQQGLDFFAGFGAGKLREPGLEARAYAFQAGHFVGKDCEELLLLAAGAGDAEVDEEGEAEILEMPEARVEGGGEAVFAAIGAARCRPFPAAGLPRPVLVSVPF